MNKGTKWTPEYALKGIEKRIKRITDSYQEELRFKHSNNRKFYKLGFSKKEVKVS